MGGMGTYGSHASGVAEGSGDAEAAGSVEAEGSGYGDWEAGGSGASEAVASGSWLGSGWADCLGFWTNTLLSETVKSTTRASPWGSLPLSKAAWNRLSIWP